MLNLQNFQLRSYIIFLTFGNPKVVEISKASILIQGLFAILCARIEECVKFTRSSSVYSVNGRAPHRAKQVSNKRMRED